MCKANCKEIGLTSPEGVDNYKQYYSYDATTFKSEPKLSLAGKDGTVTKKLTNGIDFTTSFIIIEKDEESANSIYNDLPVASVSPPERVKMMNDKKWYNVY